MNEPSELAARLDLLIRIAAISLVEGRPQREQIALLAKTGLSPKEIAELLETTSNTVRVELSRQRKRRPQVAARREESGD